MSPILSSSQVETTAAERLHEATGNDAARIEFEIEDLISRLAKSIKPDALGGIHCGSCEDLCRVPT